MTVDRVAGVRPSSPASVAWSGERNRLVGIAYRMLGDYGAAEDVVSEVAVDALAQERGGADVRSWPAWLTTVCVRRAIDRLRHLQAQREDYPGPWLPEPVATGRLPEEVVADRELLSIAVLHLAEQLSPESRAAVVLHRAFGMTAVEIGPILDRSPAAVRQLISRGERRLQLTPAPGAAQPRPAEVREALRALVRAIESGDVSAAAALLTDDAVLWADGGGVAASARNPIFGPDRILRFFAGILAKSAAKGSGAGAVLVEINGEPALSMTVSGTTDVIAFEFAGARVCGIRRISNPHKLARAL